MKKKQKDFYGVNFYIDTFLSAPPNPDNKCPFLCFIPITIFPKNCRTIEILMGLQTSEKFTGLFVLEHYLKDKSLEKKEFFFMN